MSKRAPSAEVLPVRRATRPSTASRQSATAATVTSAATGTGRWNDSATSAVTAPTSTARASVTWLAGPRVRAARRRIASVSVPQTATA